jgi:hypothetical protein
MLGALRECACENLTAGRTCVSAPKSHDLLGLVEGEKFSPMRRRHHQPSFGFVARCSSAAYPVPRGRVLSHWRTKGRKDVTPRHLDLGLVVDATGSAPAYRYCRSSAVAFNRHIRASCCERVGGSSACHQARAILRFPGERGSAVACLAHMGMHLWNNTAISAS